MLPLIDIAIRTIGMRRTCAVLASRSRNVPLRDCTAENIARANRVAELAAIAGRHGLYANTCLRQAVLVQHYLRHQGLSAQLRIGAMKTSTGDLQFHAWVELNGVALAQGELLYAPLREVPTPPRGLAQHP